MANRSIRWLGLLSALLGPALGLLPDAALSERGPRLVAAAAVAPDDDPNNARVIVKYRAGSTLALAAVRDGRAQHAGKMGERLALPLLDGRALGQHVQGLRSRGLSSRQLVARLQAQPDVEWAVVDRRRTISGVLPNDPYYGAGQTSITPAVGQWYLRAPDSTVVSAINAEGAWALSTGSAAITVAVIDTGVRFDHPDLAGKLWPGYDFVSRSDRSNDGGGRDADASDPGDWTTDGECGAGKLASDSSWHGTQVAGLIGAATDNGLGMASVGRQVMVLPVRALGPCGGFDIDIIAAMRWAGGLGADPVANPHPAQVINLSLGGVVRTSCSNAYNEVIAQLAVARVTVVVAAGNYGQNADGSSQIDMQSVTDPANCPGVIAVSAVRHTGSKVGFSSFGPEVALAAPGGNCVNTAKGTPCLYSLLTTTNLGTTAPGVNSYSDSFNTSLGTSFSAPQVAGTAALMLSVNPQLTPAQIKAALQASARPFPVTGGATPEIAACPVPGTAVFECYCTTSTCGAGMLDAGAAVAQVYAATLLPTALISASSVAPTAGTVVTLDGRGSSASAGRSISGYQWAISSGAGLASLTGATTGSTATLATSGAGPVVIRLTVTDSTGAARSAQVTVTVADVPVVVVTPPSGGGGGGGALGAGWLLGLASAVVLLGRRRTAC